VPRSQRSDDDLMRASEHLYYEIAMLVGTSNGLASGVAGESVLKNALLESFTLHARALLAFFYSDKPRPDDVVAEDFIPDWPSMRPNEPTAFQALQIRVGKEIAHLTYERLSVTEAAKQWRFVEIAQGIDRMAACFVQLIPDSNLGPNMKGYKAAQGKAANSAERGEKVS
jgi:hypothetical protein